ncbi:inactive carboxypeptidase-like protein X2 [Mya arenaria]|uniref:inactive carboxypeptidase-like protein X2 n=1 Tax=Mya arenaria TaxID=6604 RepID=UPI0022E7583E|nr:inactive carboxypeptidase-like protein X2 [Mya arenaria]
MEMGDIKGYLGSCMDHTCPAGTICVSAPSGTMARYSCLQQDNCSIAMFCPATSDICVCPMYLVNGQEPVSNAQITASSFFASSYVPSNARLNAVTTETKCGGWAAINNDEHQYIQVQFNGLNNVVGVALQGRHDYDQFVTAYKVFYSGDCVDFSTILDTNGNDMVFNGNTDRDTIVTSMLPSDVIALCVRLNPVKWNEHISLRFDILGCPIRKLN